MPRRNVLWIAVPILAAVGLVLGLVRRARRRVLPVVPRVDLDRYLGTWYEIASMPTRFQAGCVGTTATYEREGADRIRVINRCRRYDLDGPESIAIGRARVVEPRTNARLKVQFRWPFSGGYHILALDPDYRWAMVGHPSRRYLWILSRAPELDDTVMERLLVRAQRLGFDIERVEPTVQPRFGPVERAPGTEPVRAG